MMDFNKETILEIKKLVDDSFSSGLTTGADTSGLISKVEYESNTEASYTHQYKGFELKESYYAEDDCTHHSCSVVYNDINLCDFNWRLCLQKAIKFVDILLILGGTEL